MEAKLQKLAGADDREVVQSLRCSSSWNRFQLCDFAPSAIGVLRLMQKQDALEQVTQESLASLPWDHLSGEYGSRELRIDGGPVVRVFHRCG